eukprot:jgi/Picre1/27337/NNA_000306.t1
MHVLTPFGAQHAGACIAGIDLGTTNSAIAVLEGDRPVIVPNEYGHLTTPSVVSIGEEHVYVGVKAKRMAAVDPLNTFYSVKRLIGQEMRDVSDDVKEMAYRTMQDDDGWSCSSPPGRRRGFTRKKFQHWSLPNF